MRGGKKLFSCSGESFFTVYGVQISTTVWGNQHRGGPPFTLDKWVKEVGTCLSTVPANCFVALLPYKHFADEGLQIMLNSKLPHSYLLKFSVLNTKSFRSWYQHLDPFLQYMSEYAVGITACCYRKALIPDRFLSSHCISNIFWTEEFMENLHEMLWLRYCSKSGDVPVIV